MCVSDEGWHTHTHTHTYTRGSDLGVSSLTLHANPGHTPEKREKKDGGGPKGGSRGGEGGGVDPPFPPPPQKEEKNMLKNRQLHPLSHSFFLSFLLYYNGKYENEREKKKREREVCFFEVYKEQQPTYLWRSLSYLTKT